MAIMKLCKMKFVMKSTQSSKGQWREQFDVNPEFSYAVPTCIKASLSFFKKILEAEWRRISLTIKHLLMSP